MSDLTGPKNWDCVWVSNSNWKIVPQLVGKKVEVFIILGTNTEHYLIEAGVADHNTPNAHSGIIE